MLINANREEVMRKFGAGVMNDNRERLCDFCSAKGLVITGTYSVRPLPIENKNKAEVSSS